MKKENCENLKIEVRISGIERTNPFFQNNSIISSIVIDSTVKTIGGGAGQGSFEKCVSIEKVSIPNSVTNIEGGAFYFCKNLKSIRLPTSLSIINCSSFSECQSITEIAIPSSVKKVCKSAFENCSNLTKLTMNPYETKTESDSFLNCTLLTKFEFNSSVTSIKEITVVDEYWNSITEITIPETVKSIHKGFFSKCSSKIETIVMNPYSLSIEPKSFENCSIKHCSSEANFPLI